MGHFLSYIKPNKPTSIQQPYSNHYKKNEDDDKELVMYNPYYIEDYTNLTNRKDLIEGKKFNYVCLIFTTQDNIEDTYYFLQRAYLQQYVCFYLYYSTVLDFEEYLTTLIKNTKYHLLLYITVNIDIRTHLQLLDDEEYNLTKLLLFKDPRTIFTSINDSYDIWHLNKPFYQNCISISSNKKLTIPSYQDKNHTLNELLVSILENYPEATPEEINTTLDFYTPDDYQFYINTTNDLIRYRYPLFIPSHYITETQPQIPTPLYTMKEILKEKPISVPKLLLLPLMNCFIDNKNYKQPLKPSFSSLYTYKQKPP